MISIPGDGTIFSKDYRRIFDGLPRAACKAMHPEQNNLQYHQYDQLVVYVQSKPESRNLGICFLLASQQRYVSS